MPHITGTLINVVAVLAGSGLGVLFGARLPERLRQTVIAGLGIFVLALGIQMFLETRNSLVVLGSLVVGALLGEWWKVEDGLQGLGRWLEKRFNRKAKPDEQGGKEAQERFIRGFLTATLVFLVGPISILGSIQDGLNGDFKLLAVKSVLDGFASLAFASSLGIGVAFSVLPLLVYQGSISLLASQVQALTTSAMITEMTATGGVILLAIAVSGLLEIKKIRTGSFLPALLVAPATVALLTALGVKLSLP